MRTLLIITAVVLQVALLAFMAGQREHIVQTGKIVYLRTSPVDPTDPFRGEYVRLNYEITDSMIHPMRQLLEAKDKDNERSVRVYTVLDVDENQVAHARYITDKKPSGELFIRGRAEPQRWNPTINYGIEAYFVEQGQGRELEKFRRAANNIMVPLEMETAIGANGIALLKGYRTTSLGIGIETQRNTFGISTAKLTLKNVSDAPLAIVDLPDNRSLSLEIDNSRIEEDLDWRWVNQGNPAPKPENKDVHILQPQEKYEFKVDFNNPNWCVENDDNEPRSIGSLDRETWGYRFRLVYTPPSKQQCEHLENAAFIWHGQLPSQAFTATGSRD